MRCLTLAAELRRRGAAIRFVCRDLPGNIVKRVEDAGHPVSRLPAGEGADAPEATDVARDAAETIAAWGQAKPDWVVVDHYWLDAAWEQSVRDSAGRVFVIEDLRGRKHACDVLLDQNRYGASAASLAGESSPDRRDLLGPRYALLQPEYAQFRPLLPARSGAAHRVLLFFGGSDTTNETGKALEALSLPEFAHLAVDVVLGANHPTRDSIVAAVRARPDTALHANLRSLAGLMARADLAIGAGGSTSWERVCLGLPSLVTILAPNQEPVTAGLQEAGFVYPVGRSTEVSSAHYAAALRRNFGVDADRAPIVDGLGTRRVAEVLLPTPVRSLALRPATPDDAGLLFEWRNDPLARTMSFNSGTISWREHVNWLGKRLGDRDTVIFIAEVADLPVGQIRFQYENDGAILSYSLDPVCRGRGWSRSLIEIGVERVLRERPAPVLAHVRPENLASLRVFRGLGWSERRTPQGHFTFLRGASS